MVKQRLCGRADDLADEQLGLQLLHSGVCISVYKSHSWMAIVSWVVFFLHTHSLLPFFCCHKLPLTDAAACRIYSQRDLLSGLCHVCACGTREDEGRYFARTRAVLVRADLRRF